MINAYPTQGISPRSTAPVSLRDFNQNDHDILLRIYESGRQDLEWITGLDLNLKRVLIQQQYLAERKSSDLQYPSAARRLILLDGEPVGRYDTCESESFIRILSITLFPEYRGNGIGSRLIQDTMDKAQKTNRYVCLNVMWFNGRARSFYEKLGFHVTMDQSICCEMLWSPEVN